MPARSGWSASSVSGGTCLTARGDPLQQDRPDVAQERRRWRVWQRYLDPSRFVFLDETGTATNMTRRYGRCAKGQRLVAAAPYGHWKTTTFVAGLRQSGIVAPLVLDGPMNGPTFRAYVEQALAPALEPGDVVVLDNLPAHKVAGVKEAITGRGATLMYLPPYSPDLNPLADDHAPRGNCGLAARRLPCLSRRPAFARPLRENGGDCAAPSPPSPKPR